MEENTNVSLIKWEGKVSKRLFKVKAEEIWPFLTDFFGFEKWFPGHISSGIHGNNGEIGCIRRMAFAWEDGKEKDQWCDERLIAIDDVHKTFSYDIVESNIGWTSYVATIKVVNDDDGEGGCTIEWYFVVDPIEGMQVQDVEKLIDEVLEPAAIVMEDAAASARNA